MKITAVIETAIQRVLYDDFNVQQWARGSSYELLRGAAAMTAWQGGITFFYIKETETLPLSSQAPSIPEKMPLRSVTRS